MAASDVHGLAGMPVDLTIGGKAWKVGRLSILEVLGEFGKLVRERRLSDIIRACQEIQSKTERQDMVKALMRDVPKGKELEDEARETLDTVEGGVRMLWMALRKHQPTMTLEDAVDLATEKNAVEVSVAIEYAMGADLEEIQKAKAKETLDPKK